MLAKYLVKRILLMLLTLFVVITATFFLMQVMPGTPFNNPKLTKMLSQVTSVHHLPLPTNL